VGVLFVKGELVGGKAGKEGLVVVYKGEVLASGDAKTVRNSLDEVWSAKGVDLKNTLEELYDIIFFVKQITPKLKTALSEAFFWSGKTDGIGGELVALNISKSKKGITLEGLIKRNA